MEILTSIIKIGCFDTFIKYFPEAQDGAVVAIGLLCAILCMASAYLLGSINFAIVLSKLRGDDIRKHGSQNAGTTNMLRTYGKKAAVITLVGDFLKGTASALIGMLLFGMLGQYLASLFCVLGHVFPVYYKFRGGKGIATAAGTILACEPIIFLVLVAIFTVIVAFTKYVSLASIMVALLYPLILDRWYKIIQVPSGLHLLMVMIMAGVIVWKHYPNMKRLWNKTESKLSFKKKTEANEETKSEKKSLHDQD